MTLLIRATALLAFCFGLQTMEASAKNRVERPMKMRTEGVMVVNLLDGSYTAIEHGWATHLGAFTNEHSGYFDVENIVLLSATGTATAANGDQDFWVPGPEPSTGLIIGGTGRLEGATGSFTWTTTSLEVSIDPDTMTATLVYSNDLSGTITY